MSSDGFVGCGDDGYDVVVVVYELFEALYGELWCAHEYYS